MRFFLQSRAVHHFLLAAIVFCCAPAVDAAQHRLLGSGQPLLILSGGGNPHDNAVNHLDNVLWVGELWQRHAGPVWALVSDGDDPGTDMSRATGTGPETVEWWLQRLIMRTDVVLKFSSSSTPWTFAAATQQGLRAWVDGPGQQLSPGTILTLYVTDHGLRNGQTSEIVMWNETLDPKTLAAILDRLPQGVGVRLLMAQCYSGGFVEAVAALLAAGRAACGFFAAPPDRIAAGCSYEPEAAAYAEYTTPLFEALFAVQRVADRPAAAPAESFIAAHVGALATLTTADVPQLSRTAFLPPHGRGSLAPATAAIAAAAARAITAAPSGGQARREALISRYDNLVEALTNTEAQLEADLLNRFPHLLYPFVPQHARAIAADFDAVSAFLARHPGSGDWRRYATELAAVERELAELEAALAASLRRDELERLASGWAQGIRVDAAAWSRLTACEDAAAPRL